MEEVVTSLSPQFRKAAHIVTVDGGDAITLHSYPGAIAQVATNLLTNSLNHAYSPHERGHLSFTIAQVDDRVTLHYSDDGCGMSEPILKKVFDPFFTTAREQGGTGLGLHIVYNLVTQKLHGRIQIASEIGKGTQFSIELPTAVLPPSPLN